MVYNVFINDNIDTSRKMLIARRFLILLEILQTLQLIWKK